MSAATMTSKGRITLPKLVRDHLGLVAGDRVEFVQSADGSYSIVPIKSSIKSLKGCIAMPRKPITVEAMAGVIKRSAVGRNAA